MMKAPQSYYTPSLGVRIPGSEPYNPGTISHSYSRRIESSRRHDTDHLSDPECSRAQLLCDRRSRLGSTVAESNETDNTRPASVSISGVDLLPTAIAASKSGANAVSVSDTVKNQGSSNSSGSFTIRYYLSTDTTYQSGTDIALARSSDGTGTCYRTVNSLSAGSNSSVSNKTCYKPRGAVNGVNYYVIVVDDTGNTVSEYNESNNSRPTTGTINW